MDKEVAVAMAAMAVDKMQAAAEPMLVGLNTSNLKRDGRATIDKVGNQTPTRTLDYVRQAQNCTKIGTTAGRIGTIAPTPARHAKHDTSSMLRQP